MIEFLMPESGTRQYWRNKMIATLPKNAKLISTKETGSVMRTRLDMLKMSNADYVSYLDEDDELIPENVTELMEYVAINKPKSVMSSSETIDKNGKRLSTFNVFAPGTNYTNIIKRMRMPHQLIICRTDIAINAALLAAEFVKKSENNFDAAWGWEMILQGDMQFFPKYCYRWRIYNGLEQLHQRERFNPDGLANHKAYVNKFKVKYDITD